MECCWGESLGHINQYLTALRAGLQFGQGPEITRNSETCHDCNDYCTAAELLTTNSGAKVKSARSCLISFESAVKTTSLCT
jgi:hypothetical protein